MNKGRKGKSPHGRSAGSGGATVEATEPAASAPSQEPALIPRPPRRNLPLLIVSIVLLAIWLVILVWLAATA